MDFETLSKWADEEVKGVLAALPPELHAPSKKCSVSFEERPGRSLHDEELEGSELGLFEGPALNEESGGGELPRVRLFLFNLWEWVEKDEQDYRDEVGITFMHELGHYFGWEETDLEERGLE